jgi:uncharacterized protein (DUF3084 family)
MTSAYVLIVAIVLLSGVIAALGDRLGTKVGKARMRLFNLRPRQTAVVVTVITGILIAGSTLGILFASSKSLREGIFRLDEILKQLRVAQAELNSIGGEKKAIEQQLRQTKQEQVAVQRRMKAINQNYLQARQRLQQVLGQAKKLNADIQMLIRERQQLNLQKLQLSQQNSALLSQVQERDDELRKREQRIANQDRSLQQRQAQLQALEKRVRPLETQRRQLQTDINTRDSQIQSLDQAIAAKDNNLKQREGQLKTLENQLTFLQREVAVLEQYYQNYQDLRERQIAIVRGQVLAFAGVRIVSQDGVIQAIDELLRQANRNAIAATRPNVNPVNPNDNNVTERVVKITRAQVEQLIQQLQDGKDYVVRILSAGNYVQGEQEVRIVADATPNQRIFSENTVVATVSVDTNSSSEQDIQQRLDILLASSQYRARSAGILGTIQVGDGRVKTLIDFVEKIQRAEEKPDVIQAIAVQDTLTIGPLSLQLVALKNGKKLFTSP